MWNIAMNRMPQGLFGSASDFPIFDSQAGYEAEFAGVVDYQGEIMSKRDGGDHQIIGAGELTLSAKMGAYAVVGSAAGSSNG